jgi:predicted transcriptional regulator of viral defense system
MKFEELLEIVESEPVFDTGLLLAGDENPFDVRKQLSRWVKGGLVYQLRRGLYALAPPYQKITPHPFLVANRMVRGSYVSCETALSFYGLIPESVPLTISISTGRSGWWSTPLGDFQFRHITPQLFTSYQLVDLTSDQQAFVATPEKALLDLVHLQPSGDDSTYLDELRLQNLERINLNRLQLLVQQFGKPKLQRAAAIISTLVEEDIQAYEML